MLLPQHSDEFPNLRDGQPNDWRNWDLPNRFDIPTVLKCVSEGSIKTVGPQYQVVGFEMACGLVVVVCELRAAGCEWKGWVFVHDSDEPEALHRESV